MGVTLWFHQTWLENPRTECKFLARKLTKFYGPFFTAMFDYRRVRIGFEREFNQMSIGFSDFEMFKGFGCIWL